MSERPDAVSPQPDGDAELAFLLRRAGIALTAEQFAAVAQEWQGFRGHVELVNREFTAEDEPAIVFDVLR